MIDNKVMSQEEIEKVKKTNIITKTTLIPLSAALFVAAIAVHFTSVKSLAENNRVSIKSQEERATRALEETNIRVENIYVKLNRLNLAVGRIEGKLDMLVKEK